MASIALEGVSKVFPDGTRAVDGLDLEIADGEFTILVGPRARQVDGAADGRRARGRDGRLITIGSRVVNDVAPRDRDIAMVFQSYALYPHMNVAGNMGFALKLAKRTRGRSRRGSAAPPALGDRRAARAAPEGALRRPAAAGRPGPRDRPLPRRRS